MTHPWLPTLIVVGLALGDGVLAWALLRRWRR